MPTQTSKKELEKEEKKTTVPKKKSTKPKTVSTKATSQAKEKTSTTQQKTEKNKTGRTPKKQGETKLEEKNNISKTTTKKTKIAEEKETTETVKPVTKAKKTTTTQKTTKKNSTAKKTIQKEKEETKQESVTYHVQRKSGKTKKASNTTTVLEPENIIEEEKDVAPIVDELLVEKEEFKVVKEERQAKKRLTGEQKKYMKKQAMHNALVAIVITAYFILLTLAFQRMQPDVFLLDLKVFSGISLATTILLFEHAYKKDDGKWAMFGIEILVVAIMTLLLTHLYTIATSQFMTITLIAAGISIIYYSIKCLIMVIRQIRKSKLQDVKTLLAEKNETAGE